MKLIISFHFLCLFCNFKMKVRNKARLKLKVEVEWGGGVGKIPLKNPPTAKTDEKWNPRGNNQAGAFYLHGSLWPCITTLSEQSKKRNLNNSRIPKFRVSSIYELYCTRFFVSLRKLMTCKLCSFFIASRWSPSSTVQFITNWQRRSLAERFKFPVYKTTACPLASKQNCTRILCLQNVHPHCFASNATPCAVM